MRQVVHTALQGHGGCDLQADLASVRLGPDHTQEVLPSPPLPYLSHLPCVQTAGRAGSCIKAPRVGGGARDEVIRRPRRSERPWERVWPRPRKHRSLCRAEAWVQA